MISIDDVAYKVELLGPPPMPNEKAQFTLCLQDQAGNTITDLEITHTKLVHVMIIRKDLENFDHIHPEKKDACFEFQYTFQSPGKYQIMTEFKHQNRTITKPTDLTVGDKISDTVLIIPNITTTQLVNDLYRVNFAFNEIPRPGKETQYTFTFYRTDGRVIASEKYLGEDMHSALWKQDLSVFSHNHPVSTGENRPHTVVAVSFAYTFPTPGFYKIFGEFKENGTVNVASFWAKIE